MSIGIFDIDKKLVEAVEDALGQCEGCGEDQENCTCEVKSESYTDDYKKHAAQNPEQDMTEARFYSKTFPCTSHFRIADNADAVSLMQNRKDNPTYKEATEEEPKEEQLDEAISDDYGYQVAKELQKLGLNKSTPSNQFMSAIHKIVKRDFPNITKQNNIMNDDDFIATVIAYTKGNKLDESDVESVSITGLDTSNSEPDSALNFRNDPMPPKRVDVLCDIDETDPNNPKRTYRLWCQYPNGSSTFYPDASQPGLYDVEDLALSDIPGAAEAVAVALDLPSNRPEHRGVSESIYLKKK